MPVMYYGSKISPNRSKTPEGYLICHNVPIGRTGEQEYLGQEIGVSDAYNQKLKVFRNPNEVFSPATIASFEGKSVTDLHPPKMVDTTSYSAYERGHIQNVRQGTGNESDLLIADLIIKDAKLISDIDNGTKKEVSCGYDCLWVETADGYEQREIRGNHVAVVPDGRAGERVTIKDSKPIKGGKTMSRKSLLGKIFQSFAKDASPEELAEAVDAFGETSATPPDNQKQEDSSLDKVLQAIEGINTRLKALEESDKEVHSEITPEKTLDALADEVEKGEEIVTDSDVLPTAEVLTGEELPVNPLPGADSAAFIRKMKPIICAIPDAKERKTATDALIAMFKPITGVNGYAAIQKTANDAKRIAAQDSKIQNTIETNAQIACDNFNNAYKGGK